MSRIFLCRGIQCPNRTQCLHFAAYLVQKQVADKAISHCADGKRFIRAMDDHPQHNKS